LNIFLKSIIYLVLFSLLHFLYDLTNLDFLKPISGINESVYQHLKMAFFAYFFVSIIEYLIIKKKIAKRDSFWYSRLLSTNIIPWFTFSIWYLVPATIGKLKSATIEIIWAILATYISGLFTILIERDTENLTFSIRFKIIILILFFVSLFLFVKFTYSLPWIDLFVNPETL